MLAAYKNVSFLFRAERDHTKTTSALIFANKGRSTVSLTWTVKEA